MRLVFDLRFLPGELPGRRTMMVSRSVLAEALMRPFVVEHLSEVIEEHLLGGVIGGRKHRCGIDHRSVHSLMPSVVLRVSGAVVRWLDPVLHQPHAESREPSM